MKRMKNIIIPVMMVLVLGMLYCAAEEEKISAPIFSGVEEIHIDQSGTTFYYDVPAEVKYVVLGIFSSQPTTDGDRISDDSILTWTSGSRTKLDLFGRSSVLKSNVYFFNTSTLDYNTSSTTTAVNGHYWAVWGYDKWGNLTHSSGTTTVHP